MEQKSNKLFLSEDSVKKNTGDKTKGRKFVANSLSEITSFDASLMFLFKDTQDGSTAIQQPQNPFTCIIKPLQTIILCSYDMQ